MHYMLHEHTEKGYLKCCWWFVFLMSQPLYVLLVHFQANVVKFRTRDLYFYISPQRSSATSSPAGAFMWFAGASNHPPLWSGAVCARGEESWQEALHVWNHHDKWEKKNVGESLLGSLSFQWNCCSSCRQRGLCVCRQQRQQLSERSGFDSFGRPCISLVLGCGTATSNSEWEEDFGLKPNPKSQTFHGFWFLTWGFGGFLTFYALYSSDLTGVSRETG